MRNCIWTCMLRRLLNAIDDTNILTSCPLGFATVDKYTQFFLVDFDLCISISG